MSGARVAALVAVLAAAAPAGDARAQVPATPAPGRFEASVGGVWIGHQALGATMAKETTGTGSALEIFTSSTDLAAGAGFEVRAAIRVLRSLEAEMNASYARLPLKIAAGNDIENAPAVTAVERIRQLTVGAGVVWYLPIRVGIPRLAPFASAGGGYLQQLHEADTLLETGRFYQVGGGVKYLLFTRPRGLVKTLGARVDARALLRARGAAFDDKAHAAPAFGAAAFIKF